METVVNGVELGVTEDDIVKQEKRGPGRSRIKYKDIAERQAEEIAALKAEAEQLAAMLSGMTEEPKQVLTVGGKPLSGDLAHLIPYRNTDQGIAEHNAKLEAEGRLSDGRVRLKVDAEDNRLAAYDDEDTPYGKGSPLAETAAEYRRSNPDKAVRFLSEMQMSKTGKRGFEFVNDKDGKPLQVGDLKLASIPRHVADSRRRTAIQESRDAISQKVEEFQVNTEQVNREARGANGTVAVMPMTGSELASSQGWKSTKVWGNQASQ